MDFGKILEYTAGALDSFAMGDSIGGIVNPKVKNKSNDVAQFAASLNNRLLAKNRAELSTEGAADAKDDKDDKGTGTEAGADPATPTAPAAATAAASAAAPAAPAPPAPPAPAATAATPAAPAPAKEVGLSYIDKIIQKAGGSKNRPVKKINSIFGSSYR